MLGEGAYGRVVTDGRLAYKFLHDDPDLEHYTRFFTALCRLAGTGLGDDIRPAIKRLAPGYPPLPCIVMPVYGATLADCPLMSHERRGFGQFVLDVVVAFVRAGVCHRDLSLANVARRLSDGSLVLLDMDAAFVTADSARLRPEFGVYCPFFGYPADVLPRHKVDRTYLPPVSVFTMWFSAQALYNIAFLNHNELIYTPSRRPLNFVGFGAVFHRARRLANGILPTAVIDAAEACTADAPDRGGAVGPCPAAWFWG